MSEVSVITLTRVQESLPVALCGFLIFHPPRGPNGRLFQVVRLCRTARSRRVERLHPQGSSDSSLNSVTAAPRATSGL